MDARGVAWRCLSSILRPVLLGSVVKMRLRRMLLRMLRVGRRRRQVALARITGRGGEACAA